MGSCASLASVLMLFAGKSIAAPYPLDEEQQYPLGWYDRTEDADTMLRAMADEGANIVLPYLSSEADLITYLNEAEAQGIRVIVPLKPDSVKYQDAEDIQDWVEYFDAFSAVYGWYVADEPSTHGITPTMCETAYNAIKSADLRPAFIAFNSYALYHGDISSYAAGYDVALMSGYKFRLAFDEFQGMEDTTYDEEPLDGLKDTIIGTSTAIVSEGKTWMSVPQAIGYVPNKLIDYRLPTYDEAKFASYYALMHGAAGQLSFAHYRCLQSIADEDQVYPYSGVSWLEDVWKPIASEFSEHGNALQAGEIAGAVSNNCADIDGTMYRDPGSGHYYLVALNTDHGSEDATFTLNLPFDATEADLVGESRNPIPIQSDQFPDVFSDYQTHVYRIEYDVPILAVGCAAEHFVTFRDLGTEAVLAHLSGDGLDYPLGGAIGPDGMLYVTCINTDEVLKYNPRTQEFIGVFADSSDGVDGPVGITFGPDGNCYVALDSSSTVVRLDGDTGEGLGIFAQGNSSGMFDLAFGPDGDLFVTATGVNDGVMRFDGDTGDYVTHTIPASVMSYPKAILIDGGYVYVCDALGDSVIRHDLASHSWSTFIPSGSHGLDNPSGLALDEDGHLLVSSKGTDHVLRYNGSTGAYMNSFGNAIDCTFLAKSLLLDDIGPSVPGSATGTVFTLL